MFTRRDFLLNCSAAASMAAFSPATLAAARVHDVALESLSASAFAAQLNSWFIVRDSGNAIALRLVKVESTDSGATTDLTAEPRERFSLLLLGDVSQALEQNSYTFEHPRLGRFEMFIVPVGLPRQECCVYEAVFDRPVSHNVRHGRPSFIVIERNSHG